MAKPTQTEHKGQSRLQSWSTLIRLDLQPVCPLCGVGLQPAVLRFQHGYAFCQLCAGLPVTTVLHAIGVMQDPILSRHMSVTMNLAFWTPRSYGPLTLYARWTHEDARIAGIAPVSDSSLEELSENDPNSS